MKRKITRDISIEELIREYPGSVRMLMQWGIKCLACGEAIWGTLAAAAAEKAFSDGQIDELVDDLNKSCATMP